MTILNESHYPDWDINEFRIMRGDTVRTIRHFHFTTWPDFGVPVGLLRPLSGAHLYNKMSLFNNTAGMTIVRRI